MAKINLTLPHEEVAVTGKQVTFVAPCNSEDLTEVVIDGVSFSLVDSMDEPVHANAFKKDSIVSVILHVGSNKAYIQNAVTNSYLEAVMAADNALSDTSEKPVQNKVITEALSGKMNNSMRGATNGVASLDSSGKIPTSQLPSSVDEVKEGVLVSGVFYTDSSKTTVIQGEPGKLYIDTESNKTYRWSGSEFTGVSNTLALGETSSTAYRGDRGKTAYEHSQDKTSNPHNITAEKLGAIPNTRKVNDKPLSGDITLSASDVGASPSNHRSTATTYGAANSSYYGHVKLSDSVSSTNSTDSGVAATPKAVKEAYDLANGKAEKDHGTHVSFSTTAPAEAGTASVGSASTVARSDHIHPAQTTVSGNAGSATKLATSRYIDGVSFNGSANVTRYASCTTAAGTTAKTASITAGTFSLITGARVTVKFTYANTASSPTLNIGSTGAKSIYWHGSTIPSSQYWEAGAVLDFVYTGSAWELIGVAKDNSGSGGASSLSDFGITATATELNYMDGVTSNVQTQLDGKASSTHTQSASYVSAGTFTGRVQANTTAMATLSNAQVRNIYAGTSDMTAGTSTLTTGSLYFVYE